MTQEQRLYKALAKMFLWQADKPDALMPDDLVDEVKELLGEQMVDEILQSEDDEPFEKIAARLSRKKKSKGETS